MTVVSADGAALFSRTVTTSTYPGPCSMSALHCHWAVIVTVSP